MDYLFALLLCLLLPILVYLCIHMPSLVQSVAQIIVDASTLDILDVTITSCTQQGFLLGMTAAIRNTGPLPATLPGMTLSMHATGSGAAFAHVRLPTITARPAGAPGGGSGAVCRVVDQWVSISDHDAFHTFSRNLLLQAELPLTVKGTSQLHAAAGLVRTTVRYDKTSVLRGLDGVTITPLEARKPSRSLLHGSPVGLEVDVSIRSESEVSPSLSFPPFLLLRVRAASAQGARVAVKVFLCASELMWER